KDTSTGVISQAVAFVDGGGGGGGFRDGDPKPAAGGLPTVLALKPVSFERGRVVLEVATPTGGRDEGDADDPRGPLVAPVGQRWTAAGPARFEWSGNDLDGVPVAPGVYWPRVHGPAGQANARIVLVR